MHILFMLPARDAFKEQKLRVDCEILFLNMEEHQQRTEELRMDLRSDQNKL